MFSRLYTSIPGNFSKYPRKKECRRSGTPEELTIGDDHGQKYQRSVGVIPQPVGVTVGAELGMVALISGTILTFVVPVWLPIAQMIFGL